MASGGSAAPAGPNVFKNIIVGVITTVLGATVIYFLGFHDSKDKEEKKIKQEATTTGWNTYQQNLEIFSKVLKMMNEPTIDIEKRKNDIVHEIDATMLSLQNITSDNRIDSRLKNIIDLRVPEFRDFKTILVNYFDGITAFQALQPTEQEGQSFIKGHITKLETDLKELKKRDSLRIADYSDELKKEYKLKDIME